MKLKSVFVLLMLFGCVQLSIGQTTITTNPPRIDLDATPGVLEFELLFEGDPLPWTATLESDWITMDPVIGEGTSPILIEFAENFGPRRTARIHFEPTEGEAEPYTLEIRQFQGIPTVMMPVEFSVLHFTHVDDPALLPYTARASIDYQPIDTALFFSLLARQADGTEPVWVAQNIPLPEAYWHDSIQPISTRFDLGLLGFEHGQPVEMLQYSYTLSYEPDTIMPYAPSYSFLDAPTSMSVLSALGRYINTHSEPDTFLTYWIPDWFLPVDVTDKYYVGCSMPNGDLDSSTDANDENGCGPAAAANSLKWLMKQHDQINWPGTWHEGFKQLSTLMEHKNASGVDDKDFIRGKLDIIEAYNLPIKVKYQDDGTNGDVSSTSGNSKAKDHSANNGDHPTKEWMFGELKDKEDVEVGFTYPSGAGHWVVLTGTHAIDGKPGIYYKHDADQDNKDSDEVKQEHSWIKEEDGKMKLANEGNAEVDIVVSESFDPDYQPEPSSESFGKYCQSIKRTIAPGRSLVITFPENSKRCFNSTVRILNRDESNSYKKVAEWNHNSGKTRKYKNNTGKVVTVEIHNDDKYDGGLPLFKTYESYDVDLEEIDNDVDGVTDPDNTDEFGGFSIGTDDDSFEEFGELTGPETVYVDSLGALLHDFPQNLSSNGVKKITIQKEINVLSRYWNNLGLVIGIDSIEQSGQMKLSCPSTGFSQSLEFVDTGEFEFHLGAVTQTGTFELEIELEGDGSYFFDNIGIPSLVQVEPILLVSDQTIELDTYLTTSDSLQISNPGGTDLIWYIEHEADWLTVNPLNGLNESQVIITSDENPAGEERTAVLTVTGPNARNSPATITVTQPANTSSINEIANQDYSLSLFPNPNQGIFDIQLQGLEPGLIRIKLTSILGKEVWNHESYAGNTEFTHQVSVDNLVNGIYFLSVESEQGKLRKIVVVRN